MVWTELNVTAGRAQLKSLFSSFLETASPARLLCIGFFHSSRKQKTIQLELFVFFWPWPTSALLHWGIAVFQGVSQGLMLKDTVKMPRCRAFCLTPNKHWLSSLSILSSRSSCHMSWQGSWVRNLEPGSQRRKPRWNPQWQEAASLLFCNCALNPHHWWR